jgi:hypothetical protein
MSGAPERIRWEGGKPSPMGVRAAAVKMARIVAETEKGEALTPGETKIADAIGTFFGDEYERISNANDELTRQLGDLGARLLEIARLADNG